MRLPNSSRGLGQSTSVMLCGLLLGGCAALTPPRTPSTDIAGVASTQPAAPRTYQPAIDIAGRLSLRYERGGAEQAIDGKFSWNQARDATHITLLTPFGQTLATIDITPVGAVLRQANQTPRNAADVDMLTASALGWPLPVAGLRDWLQGFAQDERGAPYVATAEAAGDAAWVQTTDGWQIHYALWNTEGTPARPKRIDLQRQTNQAGKVSLRIVIDQWQPQG